VLSVRKVSRNSRAGTLFFLLLLLLFFFPFLLAFFPKIFHAIIRNGRQRPTLGVVVLYHFYYHHHSHHHHHHHPLTNAKTLDGKFFHSGLIEWPDNLHKLYIIGKEGRESDEFEAEQRIVIGALFLSVHRQTNSEKEWRREKQKETEVEQNVKVSVCV